MSDYSGEKFLDKLYSDLYKSDEVQHTMKNGDKRHEAIRRYMERLERVHSKANTATKKNLLKSFYYDKYIIKEDVLRKKIEHQNFYTNDIDEEDIQGYIDNIVYVQEESLDKWIDYLSNDSAYYPTWAKYWAFQGMLKMGNYDEGIEGYQKRSKDTEAPFVDANPEIIAKAIETIEKSINKKEINDKELESLIKTGNFSKIYALLEKKYRNNIIENSGTEGIWIKYNQGDYDEASKLCESLQNKNTHWCTASESMAWHQVCGPYEDAINGGDFYVYYTKDKNGEYTLPRIAMRMVNHDGIGEIRGISESQNLEEEMMPILEEKLKKMDFVKEKDKQEALKKIEDLRELTRIYKKTIQKEALTEEELNHLYTKKYGFGWVEDSKVKKAVKKRNLVSDFNIVKDNDTKSRIYMQIRKNNEIKKLKLDESFIYYYLGKWTYTWDIIENINPEDVSNYDEFANFACKRSHGNIRYIKPEYVSNYDELAKEAVESDERLLKFIESSNYGELAESIVKKIPNAIEFVKPEKVSNYGELATIAVNHNIHLIEYVNPKYVSNYGELARKVVEKDNFLIKYIEPEKVSDYEELATKVLKKNGFLIKYIEPEKVKNYDELAMIAVKENGETIEYIESDKVSNYEELVEIVLKKDLSIKTHIMEYIDSEKVSNYDEFAKMAVSINGLTIRYIKPENVSDYDELAMMSIKQDGQSIRYIKPENVSNYDKLVTQAVKEYYGSLEGINPKNISNYDELATISVKNTPYFIEHINPKYVSNYEELATIAVKKSGSLIKSINPKYVSNYDKLVTIAIRDDGYNIRRINPENVSNYEELARIAITHDHHYIKYIDSKYISNYKELEQFAQKQKEIQKEMRKQQELLEKKKEEMEFKDDYDDGYDDYDDGYDDYDDGYDIKEETKPKM